MVSLIISVLTAANPSVYLRETIGKMMQQPAVLLNQTIFRCIAVLESQSASLSRFNLRALEVIRVYLKHSVRVCLQAPLLPVPECARRAAAWALSRPLPSLAAVSRFRPSYQ